MLRYAIMTARTPDELTEVVQNNISEGWHPLGGATPYVVEQPESYFNYRKTTSWFMQTMTKEYP